jgi:hypothetical protein
MIDQVLVQTGHPPTLAPVIARPGNRTQLPSCAVYVHRGEPVTPPRQGHGQIAGPCYRAVMKLDFHPCNRNAWDPTLGTAIRVARTRTTPGCGR